MAVKFHDEDVERYVLAACLQGPNFWKNFPEAWLHSPIASKSYKAFKKFLEPPFQVYPNPEIVFEKSSDPDVKLFVKEIQGITIDRATLAVRMSDLFEMYTNRKLMDIHESIPKDIGARLPGEVVRKHITTLSTLLNPFVAGTVERRMIYDSARERWGKYRQIAADPTKRLGMPFHIADLDKATNGGLRPGHIVLFFANSGGYKTLTKMNLAYNFAVIDRRDVLVLTLEVPIDDYEAMIDARHSRLSFDNIISGQLGSQGEQYRQALINITTQKYPLSVSDLPDKATPADVIGELELYYAKNGKYPDVLVIDYFNEMEPNSPWNNVGERFKNLGVELRRIARSYRVPIIGSMQETREGKKIKDPEKIGTEHIGETHYFQNVCHLIVHLFQDESGSDAAVGSLSMSIKKNRYGPKNRTFSVYINNEWKYVGDRVFVVQRDGRNVEHDIEDMPMIGGAA